SRGRVRRAERRAGDADADARRGAAAARAAAAVRCGRGRRRDRPSTARRQDDADADHRNSAEPDRLRERATDRAAVLGERPERGSARRASEGDAGRRGDHSFRCVARARERRRSGAARRGRSRREPGRQRCRGAALMATNGAMPVTARGARRRSSRLTAALATLALIAADATAETTADYPLGPGDVIRITVFGHPEMTAELRVDEAGTIGYPLVGALPVAGRSTREVETALAERLATGGFIRNPQVAVLITEHLSRKVAVIGEVAKPGQYALTQASRVLDLLAQAGGVVTGIAADHATLLRGDGSKLEIDL